MTTTVANVYLSFQGVGFSSGYHRSFDVLCGDNPPTITGGYAQWAKVGRPLQRALTIFQGYDPAEMTVEVRFGRWDTSWTWQTDTASGQQVEQDIYWLEWMAGANFHQGPSPVVYVWSHSAQGGDTDLIPPGYASVPWVVTGLQWGPSLRNATSGSRIRQDATITLQHYLNLTPAPPPDITVRGGYFISRPGRDTAMLIAGAPNVRSPLVDHRILAGRILSDAKNNPCKGTGIRLQGKGLSWQIRHGVAVWCPHHQSL